MNTFIALLRGINVSGQKKLPMADLRSMLEKMDFKDTSTYIQSGNAVFSSHKNDTHALEDEIRRHIQRTFGFDVPVLVKNKADFERIFRENPFKDPEALQKNQVYFVLLKNTPDKEKRIPLQKEIYKTEKFVIEDDCVYLLCENGYGKAKFNNNLVERKLKVEATTRNYRTMGKLLEMAGK